MYAQAFLEANKLKLIIRSHEGPDARWKREGMKVMDKGHSLDHITPGLFHSSGYCLALLTTACHVLCSKKEEMQISSLVCIRALTACHNKCTVHSSQARGCQLLHHLHHVLCKGARPVPTCIFSTMVKFLSSVALLMH